VPELEAITALSLVPMIRDFGFTFSLHNIGNVKLLHDNDNDTDWKQEG
jgi:hypothetical protein